VRLLTDSTFDPPGRYQEQPLRFEKTAGPALSVEEIGALDAVLLSHDRHFDNLDHACRACRWSTRRRPGRGGWAAMRLVSRPSRRARCRRATACACWSRRRRRATGRSASSRIRAT
jgi:hypothetical protein